MAAEDDAFVRAHCEKLKGVMGPAARRKLSYALGDAEPPVINPPLPAAPVEAEDPVATFDPLEVEP